MDKKNEYFPQSYTAPQTNSFLAAFYYCCATIPPRSFARAQHCATITSRTFATTNLRATITPRSFATAKHRATIPSRTLATTNLRATIVSRTFATANHRPTTLIAKIFIYKSIVIENRKSKIENQK